MNLKSVSIERPYMEHEWSVECTDPIEVESYFKGTPAHLFDPRHGWDFMRTRGSKVDLAIWEETLTAYGFTEADAYIRVAIDRVRRQFLGEAMAQEIREKRERDAFVQLHSPVSQFVEHEQPLIPASALVRPKADATEVTG